MKKLTGAGNPFHSALDKAAGMLKRKVGTGAEFMQELNSIPGVKKEEILDRKLQDIMGMPKMTHEQFLGELGKRPAPQIEEKVLGQKLTPQELARETNQFIRDRARQYAGEYAGTSREYRILAGDEMRRLRGEHLPSIREHVEREVAMQDAPHHEKGYTLPGGENYREMLIKAPPGEEQFPGVAAHFDGEPGILASMRLKDRTGPNGEKLLHLEELQSDWHQQGREKGYSKPNPDRVLQINRRLRELAKSDQEDSPEWDQLTQEKNALTAPGVPDAPFKKNWEEMALKRLIHHAAEKGYHGIVVTPGQEQADRYSLAKHIDSIMLLPNPYPNKDTHPYYFKAFDKEGNKVADDNVNEEKLQEYIGKEPAQQLLSAQPNPKGERMISGANLQIGGEGMKGFYDKKVPNILNSIGKKYGVKTQLHGHQMNIHHDLEGYMPRDQMEIKNLHHFPITEEMRQDVLKNGLPLYKEGGEVDAEAVFMGKGGTVKELEQYLRQREGEYGVKRLQRAADEIPGLENMYTLQALKEAFGGDNAKALMTMNPADFEKFAAPIFHRSKSTFSPNKTSIDKYDLPTDEYIQYLARLKGFADVPFLMVDKQEQGLPLTPFVSGHEGRHRSRALTQTGKTKNLVRLIPSSELREPLPRKSREEYIESLKNELAMTGNMIKPEKHRDVLTNRLIKRPEIQIPEIYKDGGDVDPESVFFPKSKE